MRRWVRVVACLLLGCSNSSGPTNGDTTSSTPDADADASSVDGDAIATDGETGPPLVTLSDDDRNAALTKLFIAGFRAMHAGTTGVDHAKRFVELAKPIPNVAMVTLGADGADATATLVDGTDMPFVANRIPDGATSPEDLPATPPYDKFDLPSKPMARLLSFALTNPSSAEQLGVIGSYLQYAGYTVSAGPMTVDALADTADAGVLYLDTHGKEDRLFTSSPVTDPMGNEVTVTKYTLDAMEEPVVPKDEEARMLSAIQGSQSNKDFTARGYKVLGVDAELVYAVGLIYTPTGSQAVLRYSVTPNFVKNHVKVAKDAVVYADACLTGAGPFPGLYRAAGARAYLGYDRSVDEHGMMQLSRRYFDRALGLNLKLPKLSPKERPFDVQSTYDSFGDALTVTGGIGSAKLVLTTGDAPILRPSISYLTTNKIGATFTLFGQFPPQGTDGVVKIGGITVPCGPWSPDKIDSCDFGTLSGPVSVELDTIHSNPRKLSHWKGRLEYHELGPGTWDKKLTLDFDLRADAQSFRSKPATDPTNQAAYEWSFADAKRITCAGVQSGAVSGSGGSCSLTGNFTSGWTTTGPSPVCVMKIVVDPAAHVLHVTPTVVFEGSVVCPGGGTPDKMSMQPIMGLSDDALNRYDIPYDPDTGVIEAATRTAAPGGTSAPTTFIMHWDRIIPDDGPAASDLR